MSTPPPLPLMADGTLPPLPFLVHWLAAGRAGTAVRIERLPAGNGALPDLLASAGVTTLELGRNPFGQPFRWEGWSGQRVLVDTLQDSDTLPLRHGELPCQPGAGTIDPAITGLIDLARLEDANAASSGAAAGHGAAWDHLLNAFLPAASLQPPRAPPLAGHGAALGDGRLGAWNPLPIARRALVALPAPRGTPPWGLVDQRGMRHPVQVVEGPIGRELLTSVVLGGLEAVTFEALSDPVPGAHWEVSRTVLDNGRVRAELDPLGQVVRLCCDGRFIDWSGPALQAHGDDLPLGGPTTTTVLEDGPIRGRVAVTRVSDRGTLHLTYTLHAHEAVLRVAVTWDGENEITLVCPTQVRGEPLEVAGELAGWRVPQHADGARAPSTPIAGLRWARLAAADRRGLAVLGLRPLMVGAQAGRLAVHVERVASFALGESAMPAGAPSLGQQAVSLATPARAAATALPPALRLVGTAVPWWIGRPAGWQGEVLLGQQDHQPGRCLLLVPGCREAVRCDLRGGTTPLKPTADGDGFDIELPAGGLATIRWR